MRKVTTLLSTLALATTLAAQTLPQTERQYLSGHGCDDMVEWDFFCTDGRNSGKWTKIGGKYSKRFRFIFFCFRRAVDGCYLSRPFWL